MIRFRITGKWSAQAACTTFTAQSLPIYSQSIIVQNLAASFEGFCQDDTLKTVVYALTPCE